jgi:hypothetical protein
MARRDAQAAADKERLSAGPSELAKKLDLIDRRFGRGETYSRPDQSLIHRKIVPEWVLRVARLHPDIHMRGHAANLVEQIEILRKEGFPAVKVEGDDDGAH